MRPIRTLFNQLGLFLRVSIFAIFIAILLRFCKFPRVLEIMHFWLNILPKERSDIQDLINIINLVSRFKLFVIRKNCLKKSLLRYFFLKKAGINGLEIAIGVNNSNGKLSGHSWLVLDNRPFLEDSDPTVEFHIIYSYGANHEK